MLELGMAVEAERAHHQPLEMAQQEVSEVESAELGFRKLCEHRARREELVAVRPRQPLDTFLLQYRIERTARAAVGVGNEDLCVVGAVLLYGLTYRRRDALGSVVQLRREAAHLERAPAVGAPQRCDLARERPAGDDQGDGARIHVSSLG